MSSTHMVFATTSHACQIHMCMLLLCHIHVKYISIRRSSGTRRGDCTETSPPDHAKDIIKAEEFCKEKLADSRLGGKIDVIIGTHDLHNFLKNENRLCPKYKIIAMNTIFGW